MIAKILASASSDFEGVNYNERKNEQGKSELLVARNFGPLSESATKEEYKAYLKLFASTNSRIKNPQFHATLSCKGTEYNMEQMKDFALQWVEKMGYGHQPFLIYAHNDTDNNHVHIVSVRVDAEGKKIDHNFERIRSQRALHEIMGVDLKNQAKQHFDNFSSYNFTTQNQFALLLEQSGWIVTKSEGQLNLAKGGEAQLSVSMDQIKELIDNNKKAGTDKSRKKQIAAILYKYKAGLNHEELKDLMHQRFGLDIVYHTGKGHTTPYGYTVIDHTSRAVYKGSEILPLEKILQTPEEKEKARTAALVVDTILQSKDKASLKELSSDLKAAGFSVDRKGYVKTSDGHIVYSIKKEELDGLLYNDRVGEANRFIVNNREEAATLGKVYDVKESEVKVSPYKKDLKLAFYYGKLMDSYMMGFDVTKELKDKRIAVEEVNDTIYFIDKYHHSMYSNKEWEYDKKVISASAYNIKDDKERNIIAKLYGIDKDDIQVKPNPDDRSQFYVKDMRDYLQGKITDADLLAKDIFVVNDNNKLYMIDTKHHSITCEDEFNFQFSTGMGASQSYGYGNSNSINNNNVLDNIAQSLLTGFAQLLFEGQSMAADNGPSRAKDLREKKKKKKKQFKI